MSGKTLAASLISAGLATLITATVVERIMLKVVDEEVQRQVDASVDFLVKAEKAEPTEEYLEKRIASNVALDKPSIEDVVKKNQSVRYDKVIKDSGYSAGLESNGMALIDNNVAEKSYEENVPDIHVITTAEFMDNESEYEQDSLTYFADGGVLDTMGELVVDHVDLIGNAIPPFGELSGEPHIVYLRNTRLRREFEVIQDDANAADILAEPGTP